MTNKNIFNKEYLYDMATSKDEEGLSKFDEAKLRKELEGNKNFMAKNKDTFAKEPRFHTCSLYTPCPICEKCKVKASHLYVRCQECQIPICVHDNRSINNMIKRKNFSLGDVSEETKNSLMQLKLKVMGDKNE